MKKPLVLAASFLAGVLLVEGLFFPSHLSKFIPRRQKHTGPAVYSFKATEQCYWFTRPNSEIFCMCFDNPPPWPMGLSLEDITYIDDNADFRHLIKAKLNMAPPEKK